MTTPASLRNLNLNLLLHLDALLTQRSVSRAAEYLGLSQPTVSSALRRLRRHFGDELLISGPAGRGLTPLGVQLRPLVAAALSSAERVFASVTTFDPVSSTREFCLLATDYWVASVGSALANALAAAGSSVRLRFAPLTSDIADNAADALRAVDGVLSPHGVLRGVRYAELFSTEWVCLVDAAHSGVGSELTMSDLASLPWVVVEGGPVPDAPRWDSLAMRQLRQAGIEPGIAVTVESYLAAPWFVAGTNRITIVHRSLAGRLADTMGLRTVACPIELRPLRLALWWHPQFDGDAGHRWLRGILASLAAELQV
ncbi:LysR family transcriptional regulator [Nocardia terpenica]|uniref:LysR family transcriptional regulator n=1 Tax=Nocardia terpenica TaxID=455432 RepID=UPI002FE40750